LTVPGKIFVFLLLLFEGTGTHALAEDKSFVEKITLVEKIEVEGNSYISDDKVQKIAGIETGMSLLAVDAKRVIRKLEAHAWVGSAELKKNYISKNILLRIEEEVPWLVLDYGGSRSSWVVSRRGKMLQPTEEIRDNNLQYLISSLPRLLKEEEGEGDILEEKFSWVLRVLSKIDSGGGFPFSVSRIRVIEGGLELEPEDRGVARAARVLIAVHNEESIRDALTRYSQVRDSLVKEDRVVAVLDLRFEDRVVAK